MREQDIRDLIPAKNTSLMQKHLFSTSEIAVILAAFRQYPYYFHCPEYY
jgi:hypothetical protein